MNQLSDLEDSQLVRLINEDTKAFDALYHRYLPRVYRYCAQRLNDKQQAEDVCAQVFFEVLDKLMNGKYKEDGFFSAWIFTIARRRIIDHYRKPNIEPLGESIFFDPEISKNMEDKDEQKHLLSLVQDLGEDQKELLRLRFAAQLSFEEIAKIDGRTISAIKMSIYRTLDRIRAKWEETDGK